jgi:poly(3-hydroxybutyrate) depolymerase
LGAEAPNYPAAVANCELVGRQEANVIAMMIDLMGLDPALLHVTGYSLGGQVPNFMVNFLRVLKPGVRIPRITGKLSDGTLRTVRRPSSPGLCLTPKT